MMKKKYIAPTQQVVEMEMQTILCGSQITLSSDSQDNDVALSREFYFDDEW